MESAAPQRPEAESFDALYRGHARDVYRYSLSVVRDPADAEDVTQATFLNAMQAYGQNPPRKPRQWLIAIARNICLDRDRRAARRPQQVALHEAATPEGNELGVRADEIVSALRGLPARQRAALTLDGLEGRSRAEIAAELGIGEAAVAKLLIRARSNLRLQLDEGMTCAHARALAPRLMTKSPTVTERRAAVAHLRNCELCAEVVKPRTLAGLLGPIWALPRGLGPGATEAAGLAKLATALGGSSLAAKAAVVAAVGTLAAGAAWHETSSGRSGPAAPVPGAPASDAPASQTRRPLTVATNRMGRPVVTAAVPGPGAELAPRTAIARRTPGSTAATAEGTERSAALSPPSSTPAATGSSPVLAPEPPASTAVETPAAAAAAPHAASGLTGAEDSPAAAAAALQETGAPARQTESIPAADAPAKPAGPVQSHAAAGEATAPGQVDNPGQGDGRATAPGQVTSGNGNPVGGQATAPGQLANPGQGGGQATAPGRQSEQGNAAAAHASAPGQQGSTGQGNSAAAHASAPGQQGSTGQGNAAGNTSAPGPQGEQGNSAAAQASAPGQQASPGQGNATQQASPPQSNAGGNATAAGQQADAGTADGGDNAAAAGQQAGPGQGTATAPGQPATTAQATAAGNGVANGKQPKS